MLSLKHPRARLPTTSPKSVTDLPSEILDIILNYIFVASDQQISSIVPVSLTCHRFRRSAVSILFRTLTIIADGRVLAARSLLVLRSLLLTPNLLTQVRQLHIRNAIRHDSRHLDTLAEHIRLSHKALKQSLQAMTGLQHLRYVCMLPSWTPTDQVRLDQVSSLSTHLLRCLLDRHDIRVSLDLHRANWDDTAYPPSEEVRWLSKHCHWPLGISFPHLNNKCQLESALQFFSSSRNIKGISCGQASCAARLFSDTFTATLSNMQELCIAASDSATLAYLARPSAIPWSTLRKLHIRGDKFIHSFLTFLVEPISELTHLSLHAESTTVFHAHCGRGPQDDSKPAMLPFTQLKSLRHVELHNVCNHVAYWQVTTPKLRSFKIEVPEIAARLHGIDPVHSVDDIKWLACHVQDLERLELHVGDLENLWHPTAIPGVDVQVEVYRFLQALSTLPNLRYLRLFPHYTYRDPSQVFFVPRQPISDEQAVRIFRHLSVLRPTLQLLSIAATFESHGGFIAMAWTVRRAGEKIILTTRQGQKDYEIQQIWVGERRLSMTNRRFTHRKPYLPDYGDWTFPPYETTDSALAQSQI